MGGARATKRKTARGGKAASPLPLSDRLERLVKGGGMPAFGDVLDVLMKLQLVVEFDEYLDCADLAKHVASEGTREDRGAAFCALVPIVERIERRKSKTNIDDDR